jgi:hypothetical protein
MKERLPCSVADPPGHLESRNAVLNEEPERITQADGEAHLEIKECKEELESLMDAIMALRDVVMQQREVIRSLKANRHGLGVPFVDTWGMKEKLESQASTNSSESQSTDETDPMPITPFSFGLLSHGRTDDEMMSVLTYEDGESHDSSNILKGSDHINAVIESIREHASHVDAAIALDRLQTTKKELLTITNKLHNRTAEVRELKNQIRSLEAQLSTLELERDLYQADAARSKGYLKECIQYIGNNGIAESHHPDSIVTIFTAEASPSSSFATPDKTSSRIEKNDLSETGAADKQNQETPGSCISGWALFPDDTSTRSISLKNARRKKLALCFWAERHREVVDRRQAFETADDDQPRRFFCWQSTNRKNKTKASCPLPVEKQSKHILRTGPKL